MSLIRDRQALAAFGAAGSDDFPATHFRHARAETVAALALQPARLIGPFHGSSLSRNL